MPSLPEVQNRFPPLLPEPWAPGRRLGRVRAMSGSEPAAPVGLRR